MSVWFTADTHFGHSRIALLCYRPFADVEQMDAYLLDQINACAKPTDELYHLGDFAWGGRWRGYRDRIRCQRIHLIVGNHDGSKEVKRAMRDGLFESAQHYLRLKRDGLKVILCHYPIQHWEPNFVHLHGHSHGGLLPVRPGRKDVGVDACGFAPVSLEAVRELQPPMVDERHGERLLERYAK